MKLRDLTPEQESGIDRIIEQWISEHMEFGQSPDGETVFRVRPSADVKTAENREPDHNP